MIKLIPGFPDNMQGFEGRRQKAVLIFGSLNLISVNNWINQLA